MRAVRFHDHGGPDVLSVDNVDRPTPGTDEVLVETKAIGVNHSDTLFREGIFPSRTMPSIPGSDFAGIVVEVGEAAAELEVGDRVVGAGLGKDHPGTYAEYVVSPTDRVAQLPPAVSFAEGAAMGHAGTAAWHAVVDFGGISPGDICLIHGGGGGVGHIAVQLAAIMGATVVTTEAADSTRQELETLGADATFDFRREDLADAVLSVGQPNLIVDYHFDNYIEFDLLHVAHGGRVVVLEFSEEAGGEATLSQSALRAGLMKDVDIQLSGMFNADIANALGRLSNLIAEGDLEIIVARTYDLADAAKAHTEIVEEVFLGSTVLEP